MTREELRDCWPRLECGNCKYFNVRAEMKDVDSTCKRLDHKAHKFAVPWFKSYDCGQFSTTVCKEFIPKSSCKWLYEHWTCVEDFKPLEEVKDGATIGLVYGDDQSVRYYVDFWDWWNGTFLNEDGTYKWVYRMYYNRPSKKHPTYYELVKEYNENYN